MIVRRGSGLLRQRSRVPRKAVEVPTAVVNKIITRSRGDTYECTKLWPLFEMGIRSKEQLAREIKKRGIIMLPEKADQGMAEASYFHNKGLERPKDVISKYGKGHLDWMIDMHRERIDVVLNYIRTVRNG